jgi:hypothetical protein
VSPQAPENTIRNWLTISETTQERGERRQVTLGKDIIHFIENAKQIIMLGTA